MLFLGLFLASDLLGATLPQTIRLRVQTDPVVKSLAAQVFIWLFPEAGVPFNRLEQFDFYLRVKGRLRTRLVYHLSMAHRTIVPNVRDRTFLLLPAFLSFLYYLLRPIRLVGGYGLGGLKYLLSTTAKDFPDAW